MRIPICAPGILLWAAFLISFPVYAQESTGVPVIVPPAPGAPQAAPTVSPPGRGAGQPVLERIVVQGNQRVEPETVESYMTVRVGEPFGTRAIDESLKRLFATGLFADVVLIPEGRVLIVRVVENPIINRVAFEGNLRVSEEILSQEIQLRPRVVFTRSRVQSDVKRILDVYRRSGRFGASIEPKIIRLEQNRVDLVFEIDEGPLTGIARVSFVGNERYSDRTLRSEIFTRESRWYRFYSSATKYDPDQLVFDQQTLQEFYRNNGYADFRMLSAVAELTPDKDAFFVTFTLEEGVRYKFGKIAVTSEIQEVETDPLRKLVTYREGDWYSAKEVNETILELSAEVGNFGYAFVDIIPTVKRDRDKRTIDFIFEVKEAPRVFVERIEIGGNVRTLDKVIRREFRLVEGDAFNAARLSRSSQRIRNLGFFSKVEVTTDEGSSPDRTIIKAEVAETPTGELGIGAGYSTTDGALANIVLRERNLLGKGQDIRATITASQRKQQFDVGFTEPYFLDMNLSAGIDLFHITEDNANASSFTSTRTGGSLRLGYEINESWSQRLRYTARRDIIEIVDPTTASAAILEQEGTNLTSLVGQDLTYDRRDNALNPTKGFFARVSADYAGLGGDMKYMRGRISSGVYVPLTDDLIMSLGMSGGIIEGIDQPVRITDRFFLGGDNLRGFATAGVGPRDRVTFDALGGKKFYSGSLQFRFPIGLPEEIGITGTLFSDFGTLTEIDQTTATFDDIPSVRVSWGTGLLWKSPLGPLSFDFAWPLKQEDFDKTEVFRLRFGTRF